jgi:hypothetical protein
MKVSCPFSLRADFMVLVLLDCDGDLNQVVTLTLEIQAGGQATPTRIVDRLPPNPALAECYEQWRSLAHPCASTPEHLAQRQALTATLIQQFNQWLRSASHGNLGDTLRTHLDPTDDIVVLVQASVGLQGLPWQQWDWLAQYPKAAIAFRTPDPRAEARELKPRDRTALQPLRILMVLGQQSEPEDRDRPLPATEFCRLIAPSRAQLHQHLWDAQGWDILCLSGAHLNPENTAQMLHHGLKKAVKQGLVVVLLNIIDGLAFVPTLAALGLYTIVMREPVSDAVAQTVLYQILRNFQRGQPLSLAVRTAQAQLQAVDLDGLEGMGLPMVYYPAMGGQLAQSYGVLTWDDLNPTATLPCPYRGLGAFTAADAAVFRGRQTMVERLAYGVYSQPLVALIGAAGMGKSSLVLAGLVPQFASEAAIAIFRPGTTPLHNLATALMELLPEPDPLLALKLATGEANFLAVIKSALQHQQQPRLLLIADQFEELFTGCDRTTQAEFLEVFLSPVHAADTTASPWHTPKLTVILTLRADFLEAALTDAQLAPLLCRHQPELLMPMTPKACHAAIVEPAEAVGVSLESGLTERMIAAVENEPGRLPWLEFALTRLWNYQREQEPEGLRSHQLTHHAYDAIGGVEQAIARYAEQAYHHLNRAAQAQTRRLFTRLVQPGQGTAPVRRSIPLDDLGDRDLLTYWADHQLLVVESDRVELVHEVLIHAWDRFQAWLLEDRGFQLWQERSRSQWQQWHHARSDDDKLLQGMALTEAEQWLAQRDTELAPKARAWIAASVALRQREARSRRWRQLWFAAGLLLAVLWAGAIRWQHHQEQDKAPTRTHRTCPAAVQPLDHEWCS